MMMIVILKVFLCFAVTLTVWMFQFYDFQSPGKVLILVLSIKYLLLFQVKYPLLFPETLPEEDAKRAEGHQTLTRGEEED